MRMVLIPIRSYVYRILSVLLIIGSLSYVSSRSKQNAVHPLDQMYVKISPNIEKSDKKTIYRRLSLQLRGVIPNVNEWKELEHSKEETLESFVVSFLKQPEFAEYWGSKFGAMLRDKSKGRKIPTGAFFLYLASSLHANKPYDVLVTEMITSTGSVKESPQTMFYIRDGADPLQTAEYVGRLFYAKRVACARCHDHPYISDFTRRDYYALAAFFSQQYFRDGSWEANRYGKTLSYVPRELEVHLPMEDQKNLQDKNNEWNRENWNKWTDEQRKDYQKKHELEFATLFYEPKLGLRFPHTDDAPGGDLVRPKFLDGKEAKLKVGEDRRKMFASWLTDKSNDRFRKVIINRVWTELMGWSFFTPLDDWNEDTVVQGEEILNHLDAYFLANKLKIKELILYIVTSNAYGRTVTTQTANHDPIRYFSPQRLDSDQLLNSLIRVSDLQKMGNIRERNLSFFTNLIGQKPYDLTGTGKIRIPIDNLKEFTNAVEVERPAPYHSILAVFGSGQRVDIADDISELTIEQMLTLMNGRVVGKLVWDFGNNQSLVKAEFDQTKSMNQVIQNVYFRLLGRFPTNGEWEKIKSYQTKPDTVFDKDLLQDIFWALLNSQEFQHIN
ncbi:DUF1553 domain-containing protein [Leptospira biflexa]|uniref:DUF1553 domain-containing protein n=1 Tax=Leptospira biflexa TaxID=172 RepID=UPI001090D8EF|nr:DUF1553 domain-containing protein [Leptospira biflexa]TGM47184.1 DUF1553 domain-containing protein [Leptospira biflexa]TGM50351.1 DUF1553 domain-containing protein [Leptospira biflexa]